MTTQADNICTVVYNPGYRPWLTTLDNKPSWKGILPHEYLNEIYKTVEYQKLYTYTPQPQTLPQEMQQCVYSAYTVRKATPMSRIFTVP